MLLVQAIGHFKEYMANSEKSRQTIKGYTLELKMLSSYLASKYNGPVYLEEVTSKDLEEYIIFLKEKGNSASSRNRSVYIIRSFYNFCLRREYTDKNPSIRLEITPAPEKERVFLSEEEMEALISAVQPQLAKTILTTLFYTGMRISECVNLKLKDVDLENGVITVRNTKNKRDRQIPVHKKLLPVLKEYCVKWRRPSNLPYLFISRNMGRVSPDYVNRILRNTAQRLGWKKHVTCHIIRHSFASSLVARNVSIVSIQKLLGHTDLSTTSVYTHTNLSDLIKAVNTI